MVSVLYFGSLKEISGKRQEKVRMEDSASLLELIQELARLHGPRFREFVYSSSGKLREGLAYALDGETIARSKLGKITCKEAKEFVILPPISGGSPKLPKS